MTSRFTRKPIWQNLLSYGTAIVLLIGFSYLCFFMISKGLTLPETEEYKWSRMVFIFNALQAIAVAAAGVLLGTNVAMKVTEAQVADAKNEANENKADAEKARAARKLVNGLDAPGNDGGSKSPESQAQVEAIIRLLRS